MFRHCMIAILLSAIWYYSDLAQALIQTTLFLLCLSVLSVQRTDSETGTGANISREATPVQLAIKTDHVAVGDEPDSAQTKREPVHLLQYPNVQKSLHNMFKCAYSQLVLPWYAIPEPTDSQPLYSVLLREFDFTTDRILGKAVKFDPSIISVGCIRVLTQHLRNAKQSCGSPAYSCSTDEMAVLRDFSKALVCNLFSRHLWEQPLYYCALREILATRAQTLVTLLSDPDNLNCLVVSQLGGVMSESSEKDVQTMVAEDPALTGEETGGMKGQPEECLWDEGKTENKAKKLGAKISKGLKKRFSRIKAKTKMHQKKMEENNPVRLSPRPAMVDTSSNEGSISDSEDNDMEYETNTTQEEMMEFKLSYEMWRAGQWDVRVTNVLVEDEELCFTVHLKEPNSPENFNWDVTKNQSDIVDFYTHCKDKPQLPSISTIVENPETELNDDFREKARATLENFLQVLVEDPELGHTQLVFKFFCPLHILLREEQCAGGLWGLLGGLASFLNPGQEDDELNNFKGEEKPDKNVDRGRLSETKPQQDVTQHKSTDTEERGGEENCAWENEKRVPDSSDSLSEQPGVLSTESASAVVHSVNFVAKSKVLIPKIQPAALSCYDDDAEGLQTDDVSDWRSTGNVRKKENLSCKKSLLNEEAKFMEEAPQVKEEMLSQPQEQEKMSNSSISEQPEINKVIFDLLKEISGNSYTFKIIKTVLLPFMRLIKKKVTTFLKTVSPSEAQIAAHIDGLCKIVWPEEVVESTKPPRSSEDKLETKDKAMQLLISKLAGYRILSKTDLENTFKIFQDPEENKKLIYMLLVYLLREFLPEESFTVISKLNVKDCLMSANTFRC